MSLKKIDQAIEVLKFILPDRKKLVSDYEKKVQVSENQKIFIGQELQLIRAIEMLIREVRKDVNMHLGKLPPQATDLEYTVLGAAILEKPAFDAIKTFLLPEHFYLDTHNIIYAALLKIKSHDMQTLAMELRRSGQIEIIGGAHYIAELTSRVSSSASIQLHAGILIEMAIKRKLIMAAGEIVATGYDDSTDCFELLQSTEDEIAKVKSWIPKSIPQHKFPTS